MKRAIKSFARGGATTTMNVFFNSSNEDECYERSLPEMVEYGSSGVYEEQDEFYKKYCRWCSSLVCTGVEDVKARKGCKCYQHDYKERIIEEMKLLGATQDEIDLLTVQIVLNGINNNREPKSVAWAILQ